MLPKNVSEAEVSALFSIYGTIKDLQILRGSQQTSKGTSSKILSYLFHIYIYIFSQCLIVSKQLKFKTYVMLYHVFFFPLVAGCAFLKYETKEQALAALEAINGKHKMEVCLYLFDFCV